mmetsp:Transcript_36006/g.74860  ORF Transcript_36006/g.74860 Transcript_36006/m.74860 type:complete len:309 (+) Transcript_36006:209-1135(+)
MFQSPAALLPPTRKVLRLRSLRLPTTNPLPVQVAWECTIMVGLLLERDLLVVCLVRLLVLETLSNQSLPWAVLLPLLSPNSNPVCMEVHSSNHLQPRRRVMLPPTPEATAITTLLQDSLQACREWHLTTLLTTPPWHSMDNSHTWDNTKVNWATTMVTVPSLEAPFKVGLDTPLQWVTLVATATDHTTTNKVGRTKDLVGTRRTAAATVDAVTTTTTATNIRTSTIISNMLEAMVVNLTELWVIMGISHVVDMANPAICPITTCNSSSNNKPRLRVVVGSKMTTSTKERRVAGLVEDINNSKRDLLLI